MDCFNELGEVTSYPNTVTAQEVAERVGDADVIVCNKAPMKEESLKDCPNVKLICELATGYDNCDLAYCKSRGIKVANVVDYSTAMVAQHTFTLALALSQKMPYYDEYVKSGAYSAQDRFFLILTHHGQEHLYGLSAGGQGYPVKRERFPVPALSVMTYPVISLIRKPFVR